MQRLITAWLWVVGALCVFALPDAFGQVLDTVEVLQMNGADVIKASFSTPVQYVRHFPSKSGETVQIYLRVTRIGPTDPDASTPPPRERKTLRPKPVNGLPLRDVTYEEDGVEGPRLIVRFNRRTEYKVAAGADNRSIMITVPHKDAARDRSKRAPAPDKGTAQGSERAAALMQTGRDAITRGDNVKAIRSFTDVLSLPQNTHSADALELLGLARERNGQTDLAKVEYRLYLKLYPEGEGAERVRQRLVALMPAESQTALKTPKKDQAKESTVYGTLAQNYFRGVTRVETGGDTPTTFEDVDQSALVTHLDVIGRYRNGAVDSRAVFSGDLLRDFLASDSHSRVSSAYLDTRNSDYRLWSRLGRQTGNVRGVLGRFDGLVGGYHFLPKWGVNVVVGEPVDTIAPGSDRQFHGVDLAMGTFAQRWSGNLYFIEQEADGVTDRQAVGGELRYFDTRRNFFSLVDYDTHFNALNIALFQGNWQTAGATAFNLLLDYRKSPPLQTTNALQGEPASTLGQMLDTFGEAEVQRLAESRTATSKMAVLGAVYTFNAKMQWGVDVTLTNISDSAIAQGTGNILTYATQLVGRNVLFTDDVSVVGASYTDSDTFSAISTTLVNRVPFGRRWHADFSLRFLEQDNAVGTQLTRFTPAVKLDYRLTRSVAFEFEAGQERSQTTGLGRDEDAERNFLNLGYRWDF